MKGENNEGRAGLNQSDKLDGHRMSLPTDSPAKFAPL